ncbi:pentatricopeptide repeat-containing protein DOT4, chloroplastic-like isoform X1 [Zingiber officinale]|uniref:pentatricopeptide repeat-containing protein DOT4, chloroplastic-like isoform X1 n=2 Tax=Zingiber officinale TaxID=94328 RepID=UPI001C4CDF7D|nr:pentatricopeptide repeat-containing protein DOT4, chloroplastic-like isoform X1 [Zingiber officinale]XP_042452301.1 pentatricopeptide repeat-containing protein DOT4, chloroplastic-like isoform X1 [Zingiber officinale]XP_042452302.1 pentatricopeptide repeat-containing protein DOT4, chloroplastic-like isoform X1 [Zingiber officinale]XP_042452303.1 pentatricopeptide repeat-containing protein DOT4, chloroplastic-like isoform X1 [Zingiber officinale]
MMGTGVLSCYKFHAFMLLRKLGMLLQECSTKRTFRLGVALHASVVKNGVESDLFLSNHLINMYAKCKDFESSNCIFDHMPIRNIVSWSALIAGYDQASNPSIALNLFAQMPFQPNEYIYGSIISSCATLFALAQGRQVHGQSLKNGYEGISFVYNSLMSMYIKCDCMDDALRIFRSILKPNSISYNAMITGFAEKFKLDKSLELFRLMNQQGLHPDEFSYVALLGICSTVDDLVLGLELHCQTVKRGLDTTAFVGNVILKMYSICNLSEEVDKAFMSINNKDIITYNTYIDACSNCQEHMKGLMLFREMTVMENNSSLSPDAFTTASALAICAELALFHYGGQIHAHLVRTWMNLDIVLFNALINMYAKCGCSRYAMLVFDLMPINNVISYNTIIAGLGNHGHAMTTLEIFEQMKREGFTPESVTFIGLLTACSHAGLVDEGLTLFNSMEETYGICPEIEHLSCLIDMLGRSGRLLEAEDYIKMSPYQNDYVIWGNLLSSCRLHKDVAIGERVAIKLLELQPSTSSPYVLLANLYASDGKWEGAAEARKLLRYSRVKKEPGYSLIEVKGVAEKFTVGNFSHEQIGEIVATLDSLHWITGKVHE